MKTVLFATENESKVNRFKAKLLAKGIKIITINDLPEKLEIEENGKDTIENALIKARAYAKVQDLPVFAMDDSLYIENIPQDKQPGMYVRRVNGKRLTDEEMLTYYTNLAHEYGINGRLTCRWVYGIATINNKIESTYTFSKDDFYIVDKPSTKIEKGYPLNTISVHKKLNKYFTDITKEEWKNQHENEEDVIQFLYDRLS